MSEIAVVLLKSGKSFWKQQNDHQKQQLIEDDFCYPIDVGKVSWYWFVRKLNKGQMDHDKCSSQSLNLTADRICRALTGYGIPDKRYRLRNTG